MGVSWGPKEGLLPASGTSALVSGVDPSPGPGRCQESNEALEGHPRPTPCPAKLWERLWPPRLRPQASSHNAPPC